MIMSLPICDICATSGVLCGACEKKLTDGKVSGIEVELSKILVKIDDELNFESAIELGGNVVILAKKENIGKLIGKNGATIKQISSSIGKQIRVIGTGDLKDTIHDFIAPARVKSINKVYQPAGKIIQRVRIDKRDENKLRMSIEDMNKLISSLTDDDIEISIE